MTDDLTARKHIRAWFHDAIDGHESIDLTALTDAAVLELQGNREFCARFIGECLRPMVYQIGFTLLSQARSETAAAMTRMSSQSAAERLEEGSADWSKWLEYDPGSGRHVLLFALTKEQALAAAEARESRADPDLRRAGLLRLAAGRLEAGQRIDAVWTAESLAEIEGRLRVTRPKYSLGKGTIMELMQEQERGAA